MIKSKNKNREVSILPHKNMGSEERAPVLNFSQAYNTMVELIRDQATLSNNGHQEADLKSLQLTRAKAQNYLEAVFNVVQLSHLHEIVESDAQKFRRVEEMEVMNPLLRSLKLAAIAGEKSLTYLTRKLDVALEAMECEIEVDEQDRTLNTKRMQKHLLQTEMIASIQAAHTAALENVNRIVAGLTRVIQLERFSGARPWGTKGGGVSIDGGGGGSSKPEGGEQEAPEKPKKRQLDGPELIRAMAIPNKRRMAEAAHEDYDSEEDT